MDDAKRSGNTATSAPQMADNPMEKLLWVMERLRDPEHGCPWDVEQSFETIAPYTIEEAYEVADAIRLKDMTALREELGDLLFQVVFHSRMAEEREEFDFLTVAKDLAEKMIRRHPHVFGDGQVASAAHQIRNWEDVKAAERTAKQERSGDMSLLADVPLSLPALMRAEKLQKRAARVGFDWPQVRQVFDKIDEELAEIQEELKGGASPERLNEEVGDLLFAVANLARHLGADPEAALRDCNAKFEKRFRFIEDNFAGDLENKSLDELEEAWQRAKSQDA
ncbi:MAG: nucleoside triphosphate pyrophosphohydrolase [Kiloniellales bacterium]|nr:nucleoside triphosphate pyrophosphohydrolase [Kiloniellales bacterium]